MRTKLTVATAIAGSMLATCLVWGSAQATSAPLLKSQVTPGMVTLVGHGGHGSGHGGGWSHGGGPSSGFALRSGPGTMSHMNRGYTPRGNYVSRDRGYMPRDRYVSRDRGDRFEHRRFAERGHDFDRFHHRHRVFRNGVWVWVYGPDYYAYDNDCWWLRRQALITGSPYWWSRYNYCVGYY